MEEKRVSKPSKKPSIIRLHPSECLTFDVGSVPLNLRKDKATQIPSVLKITNPTNEDIRFKVKTTAPKQYCVKPNSGKLKGGASIDINVSLVQPLPSEGETSKDKFLVQTLKENDVPEHLKDAPSEDDKEKAEKEKEIWKVNKELIMEDKLKCLWEFGAQGGDGTKPDTTSAKPVGASEAANPVAKAKTEPTAKVEPRASTLRHVASAAKADAGADMTTAVRSSGASAPSTSGSSSSSAVAQKNPATPPATEVPSLLLLLGVFLLGYIFGKFVI